MLLIGLHGPAGSGKDTGFGFIRMEAEARGLVAVRHGFADKLKLSIYRLFKPDCTVEEAVAWCDAMKMRGRVEAGPTHPRFVKGDNGQWLPENLATIRIDGRTLMERHGTESHRDVFGDDFWLDAVLPADRGPIQFWENFPGADIAVITDVRFPNEAERIQDLGGQVWMVDRQDPEFVALTPPEGHPSRLTLPSYLIDRKIPNGFGLDDYREQVRIALNDYIGDTT